MDDRLQPPDEHASQPIDALPAPETVETAITSFIDERVAAAGADGVVVAMSGGLDSTVTATLAADALGPDGVLGLALPCHKSDASAAQEASVVADQLSIPFERLHLQPLLHQFDATVAPAVDDGDGPTPHRAHGNAVARFRMVAAYYVANRTNRLVLGTANRSELLLGYVTKYGDGAADLFPLGELYKTEVRELATHLGLPEVIVERTPSAGHLIGRTDADDLGATYDLVDSLLYRVLDCGEPVETVVSELDIEDGTARRLLSMCAETAHKRARPPRADITERAHRPTVGDDAE